MKVMKFGGTSVGSAESILKVKAIVEACDEPVVVVVSALSGITDKLIATAQSALAGDAAYLDSYSEIVVRHHRMIDAVIGDMEAQVALLKEVDALLDDLKSIYQGVYLIRDLSEKTQNAIVSYGERISSLIVAELIDKATWHNALDFVRTERKQGRNLLATEPTYRMVRRELKRVASVAVVPGFISKDIETGEITNLGRGGSDYTASVVAAALDAHVLEIWTDVDGFMTADPRVINTAYTISRLSYVEAMELCNFGAKVVYPPTIYPVCIKNIPIVIKNTFRPEAEGTVIAQESGDSNRAIKGISSINDTSLITVAGLSMVGVIGVNQRIFSALAREGISVFMVSQASSENNTSIGVRSEDADKACRVLDDEFQKEIAMGAMFRMNVVRHLATVAVVGENMKHTPGIAGKLFGTLGRNGISVIAFAQGASETNISFVVESRLLRKSLNVIHDSFFLSEYQVLNLFICGVGTVGNSLIEQIAGQRERLMRERGLKLNVVGIASSRLAMFDREGLPLDNYRERLQQSPASNTQRLREEVIGMNIFNSVFVDCTASADVAALYHDFFEHSIAVVAANKVAASSDYDNYARLKATARRRGVKYLFETNVGAGLPIINTINDLICSGDRILKLEAVLSGTLNYIFNTLSATVPFSETVRRAKAQGYSEPDPRIDLSGTDVIRKLVILAREAGWRLNQEDVEKHLFIPDHLFDSDIDTFWQQLPTLDAQFEQRRRRLEAEGKRLRFVATFADGSARVELKAVDRRHPFYALEGSNNIVLITTERYRDYPMLIQGYGAGADVTAAGVFADIMSVANV
ncbi:MAG: bifunctional aspartate kinase/homoserine dehydrogenase I [Prevotellaceae bacterium]|nr:bifunctional aspartate kinase/homoserine dehydrogenase I [Prevotellaceae bacterium]